MTNLKLEFRCVLTEAQATKLEAIAGYRRMTMEECVIDWIETNAPGGMSNVQEQLDILERLVWMNLYWAHLPYANMPKVILNDEELEQMWDNAKAFAEKFASR